MTDETQIAVIEAPVKPPRKKRERFKDIFSIQLAPKMISEQKSRWGGRELVIKFPQVDEHLARELREKIAGVYYAHEATFEQEGKPVIDTSVFTCPASAENIQAIYKFGKSHRFVFDGDMAIRALSATDEGRELERMSSAKSNSLIEIPKLALPLYSYQRAGVAYMLKAKKCLNADEMGLGKTIQAIAATATVKAYPVLVIAPATLKINWYKEWIRWCPRRKSTTIIPKNDSIKTIHKTFSVRKKAKGRGATGKIERKHWDVVIVNYDRLDKWLPYLKKVQWKAVIFDESHYTKNRGAKRTHAAIALMEHLEDQAEKLGEEQPYIWLLSGTPIKAKPDQLIPQLRVMGRLDDFGGRGHFQRKYCWIHENSQDGGELNIAEFSTIARKRYENLIELNSHLRSLCFIRREKSEVLTELPPKTRSTIPFELDHEYRKLYERVETDTIDYIMDLAEKDEKFLESIKKYPRVEREAMLSERRAEAGERAARARVLVMIEHLKQTAAIGKMEKAIEWIEDFLESGEKLVVFCTHKIVAQQLLDHFNNPRWLRKNKMNEIVKIVGGQSDESRNESVEAFQNDPKTRLMICSIKAGGLGLTLTASSNVAFLELAWGPADHDQAEDRCHRIGQADNVTAWYLLAKDTIEEKIAQLIESKRLGVNAVTDGDPMHNMSQGSIYGDLLKLLTGGKVLLV